MEYIINKEAKVVTFKGTLTERDDLVPLASEIPREAICDVGGITRINSAGIRQWIHFIRALPPDSDLRFENCPVAFVSQLNMISNFIGPARVVSIYVPCLCPSCETAVDLLVPIVDIDGTAVRTARPACPSCATLTELDVDETDYLRFLRGT